MKTIYGLLDPRTGKVCYVGASVDLRRRVQYHMEARHDTSVAIWVRELKAKGREPIVTVLEETENWRNAERKWIAHYGLKNLLNESAGGEGVLHMSEAIKARIGSAIRDYFAQHPEVTAKMNASRWGKRSFLGRHHSTATLAKMSKARRRWWRRSRKRGSSGTVSP